MKRSFFVSTIMFIVSIICSQITYAEEIVVDETIKEVVTHEYESDVIQDETVVGNDYTVTFIDEVRNTRVEKKVKEGETVEAEKVSEEYIYINELEYQYFDRWIIKDGKKSKGFDFDTPIYNHIILYAQYEKSMIIVEEPLEGRTVEFDSQGGTDVEMQLLLYGDLVKEPDVPIRQGYKFLGWYTETDGGEKWDFKKDRVDYYLTLYAHWEYVGETDGYGVSPITGWEIRNILMLLLSSYIIAAVSEMKILKSSRT